MNKVVLLLLWAIANLGVLTVFLYQTKKCLQQHQISDEANGRTGNALIYNKLSRLSGVFAISQWLFLSVTTFLILLLIRRYGIDERIIAFMLIYVILSIGVTVRLALSLRNKPSKMSE